MTSAVNPLQDIGTVILGTRGSKLAMAQSGMVAQATGRETIRKLKLGDWLTI